MKKGTFQRWAEVKKLEYVGVRNGEGEEDE